jgi:hypothetical protein
MNVERLERTFSCSEAPVLRLSNIRGSVEIRPGDDGVIAIVAEKHLDSGDKENTRIEISQSNAGLVNIHTRYASYGFRLFRKWFPCKVDYAVRVPRDCSLKIRGVSNSTTIEGLRGKIEIATVSGKVDLRSLAGELKLRTVSGDVQGEGISAPIHLDAVSGEVRFLKSDIPQMVGKTVSGDLIFESPLGDGPYDLMTVSGDIELILSRVHGATITSTSLSGRLKTSVPSSYSNQSLNQRRIEIEGGGVDIHHSSVSGDLILINEDKSDTANDIQENIRAKDLKPTRTDILDQVERGELSVEKAVQMFGEASGS